MIDAFDKMDHIRGDPVAKARHAVKNCCMSVTMTTGTDVAAFGLCLLMPVPVVRWFATYAICSLLFVYGFALTAFVCLVNYDLAR